ncbi:MAG: hypothetical protein ONA69_07375 [candidate division KSB1 bacterium]|nr:hypothetical protein [candidate division KSB1 bacterium]MDZ7346601.1 hypothetical protein [candidate division KSB1 bacterium]
MHKRTISLLSVFFAAAFHLELFASDIFFRQQIRQEAVTPSGQIRTTVEDTAVVWLTGGRASINSREYKTVLDWQKKLLLIADHRKKTIVQISLDFDRPIEQAAAGMSPQERAEFQRMMGQTADLRVSVQAINERRTIGRWECRKYVQTLESGATKINTEIWATQDIAADEQLYAIYSAALFAQIPGVGPNLKSVMEEMKKIKGVYVLLLQQREMIGQTSTSRIELLEYREAAAPADAFAMPADYRKQAL